MFVARILYPVEVLGIGKRVGIWLCGCNHKCEDCANPELWAFDKSKFMSVNDLYDAVFAIYSSSQTDGFTITGGEPFEQAEELSELVVMLTKLSKDIIIYSGYTMAELSAKKQAAIENILSNIAVLIDGRYEKQNNNGVFMRGSSNQKIHILNKDFAEIYHRFFESGTNKIQNFHTSSGIFSIGIHKADFRQTLAQSIEKFGLRNEGNENA